jgi:predicted nucleic acid-binding Zn ribbon protein
VIASRKREDLMRNVMYQCETCGKSLTEGVQRFCGDECRRRFVEGLRKGTLRCPGRTVARRLRRRGG